MKLGFRRTVFMMRHLVFIAVEREKSHLDLIPNSGASQKEEQILVCKFVKGLSREGIDRERGPGGF